MEVVTTPVRCHGDEDDNLITKGQKKRDIKGTKRFGEVVGKTPGKKDMSRTLI
jgi:hypothetical protein